MFEEGAADNLEAEMRERLAAEAPAEADLVLPIPDSGTPAAQVAVKQRVLEDALWHIAEGDTTADEVIPYTEFERRKTLPFNGYGDEVAKLYAGMDPKTLY